MPFTGYEEVGEQQGHQRHHAHQDAGEADVDPDLAPGDQRALVSHRRAKILADGRRPHDEVSQTPWIARGGRR